MDKQTKYAIVRKKLIDDIKKDLIGPISENEILNENPRFAYITGILDYKNSDCYKCEDEENEENIDEFNISEPDIVKSDININVLNSLDEDEEFESEPLATSNFRLPISIGISFYISNSTSDINLDISWGDYEKSINLIENEEKKYKKIVYKRKPMFETINININEINKSKIYSLNIDSNIKLYVYRIKFKNEYSLVTVYLVNKRNYSENNIEGAMYQVELKAYDKNKSKPFIAEHICKTISDKSEFYFRKRSIMGRGKGCAAIWDKPENGRCSYVKSSFIPEYELPKVSAQLDGFDDLRFSTFEMSKESNKNETLEKLKKLADLYEDWITVSLINNKNKQEGNQNVESIIEECKIAASRIKEGVEIIEKDEIAYEAFSVMNQIIYLQNSIKNYSKNYGEGIECNFGDFVKNNGKNNFEWRPFQIAFILINIKSIVDPSSSDREIVDLLYFPTGGGKTEAYLGLMAFTIINRRLRINDYDEYNRDGGVTIILRYTLRLLTIQQRDRITKMVIAAEKIREKNTDKFGKEPINIGIWIGSNTTPNNIGKDKLNEIKNTLVKQLPICPFCGTIIEKENINVNIDKKSTEIYCSDKNCIFYVMKNDNRKAIPVYLIDEEIYLKCPTIIISTVDKFASLPMKVETNSIFGRVNRKCDRHGYIPIGCEHQLRHNKNGELPKTETKAVKQFMPPELIVQDELHLISGPLGTIYGGYETLIEKMCSLNGIKPKYVVSTATIKNADNQIKNLYARNVTKQFPPNGFEIGDSFFIREIPIEETPFRKYIGICAQGHSMKTALTRIYGIILQASYNYYLDPEYKEFIDPYYTLIGYFNSIRELGGALRLIQDDIKKRIARICTNYNIKDKQHRRFIKKSIEITSREHSSKIPKRLSELEIKSDNNSKVTDIVLATNMIAVGMDVDRLGLMVVTGQPKQNSEYIQATSRIGRTFPGLVITLYNPYKPRDLSHYENFTGYHSQLYRFVEGTTATPFSETARDRVLHSLIIAAIRLLYTNSNNKKNDAKQINLLTEEEIKFVKKIIFDRVNTIKPVSINDVEEEITKFINEWKHVAQKQDEFQYRSIGNIKGIRSLFVINDQEIKRNEKYVLPSMREVESASNMYYYEEEE